MKVEGRQIGFVPPEFHAQIEGMNRIRVDDAQHMDFWLSIHLDVDDIQKLSLPVLARIAHKRCSYHLYDIRHSHLCGCFYCKSVFPPADIAKWVDDGHTAVCPLCGIDAVIGDYSGYPVDEEFLGIMHKMWFGDKLNDPLWS